MNINPSYDSDNNLDAETAMQVCMIGISELLIDPAIARGELSEDEQDTLTFIGMTLKHIAEKAKALEALEDISNQKKHFRN